MTQRFELPPHPGCIVVIDGNTNRVVREIDTRCALPSMCYAHTEKGWVAITRIIEFIGEHYVSWRAFSADGRVVRVGTSIRE